MYGGFFVCGMGIDFVDGDALFLVNASFIIYISLISVTVTFLQL